MSYDYLNVRTFNGEREKMKNGGVDYHSVGSESGDHRIVYVN